MAGRLLDIHEVSARTRAPVETLRYWRQQGVGPKAFRLGRRLVWDESEVERWLDEQAQAQGASAPTRRSK
jgi:predicted DNA-binding transcriptional regulator AlpA